MSAHTAWQRNVVQVAVVVLIIATVQMILPDEVTIGPRWLIPAIEIIGAPALLLLLKVSGTRTKRLRRAITVYLLFLIAASVLNASLLFVSLLQGKDEDGALLLLAGFGVLIINVLSFGIVYWFMDGGGPAKRAAGKVTDWDFQFPQQASGMKHWQPELPDYLFTAYTNIIAFSPTDTMPLTHRAKGLFTIQSGVSLVTILVTLSRAINLIG